MLPSDDDVQFFEEHGWWISPPLLSSDDLDDARFGVDRYYAGERDTPLMIDPGTDWTEASGNVLRQNDYVSLQIAEFQRLVRHPAIAAAAARLARTSEVRLFHDQLLYKPPGASVSATTVGWHTDIAYWRTCSSVSMLTAWIPLQDSDEQMGTMMVLDGSHRWSGNDQLQFFHESELQTIESRIARMDPTKRIPIAIKAGQVSFHHCRTIHGSHPNRSDRPRIAYAIHFQDRDNRFTRRYDARGRLASHINDLLCRRNADGDPDYTDPDVFPVLWSAETACR